MAQLPHITVTFLSAVFVVAFSQATVAQGDSLDACLAEAWLPRQIDCLKEIAIEEGDPALCLISEKPSVRWLCVALYAEQAGEASICEVLPLDDLDLPGISADLCRAHLAIAWRAPALCEELTTPNLADSCLLKLVELGEDKALCDRIENETLARACSDN